MTTRPTNEDVLAALNTLGRYVLSLVPPQDPAPLPNVVTLQEVQVSPTQLIFNPGDLPQQLTATGIYSDGSTRNVNTEVLWVSGDLNVCTVQDGLVTQVGGGQTTIQTGPRP